MNTDHFSNEKKKLSNKNTVFMKIHCVQIKIIMQNDTFNNTTRLIMYFYWEKKYSCN